MNKPDISMEEEIEGAMFGIREFLFECVYTNSLAKTEDDKAINIVKGLYKYYEAHTEVLPNSYLESLYKEGIEPVVCDYIAGMTDTYAVSMYEEIFIPKAWRK
jgi:dGTPase